MTFSEKVKYVRTQLNYSQEELARLVTRAVEENNLINAERYTKVKKKSLFECLRVNYDNAIYLEEALECQPNDTPSRRDIWRDNPILQSAENKFLPLVPTLTTKQDRHPNAGNLYFNPQDNIRSMFRYLTPRECFILIGFDQADFDKIKAINFPSRKIRSFFVVIN